MVCHSYLALLPDQGVAEWPWNQWPDGRGTGGRISVESVAEWAWNTQVSRVFNDIQHEQVWRALQLIHGVPLAGYEKGAPVQLAGNADDRLVYVPKLSEAVLEKVTRVAGLGGRLVVYSWQPGQIRQRVEAPNVAFEKIPEFLVSRFGGGK